MIGGDAFKVMKISSAVNRAGDVLVGGIAEMLNVDSETFLTSFMYMLKTSDCSISWAHEFPTMDLDQ